MKEGQPVLRSGAEEMACLGYIGRGIFIICHVINRALYSSDCKGDHHMLLLQIILCPYWLLEHRRP